MTNLAATKKTSLKRGRLAQVAVIIPALDEEAAVGFVVEQVRAAGGALLREVIVVDNGSRDRTAERARAAGASVTREPQRGYGAACLAGLAALDPEVDLVVFLDADGSDDPGELPLLLAPILAGEADLVIGSRILGTLQPGAMTWPQRFGNWLAPALIRLVWGVRFTDLGPFRAIRRDALESLAMADRDFGWTVEMQIKAARFGLRCCERPVSYKKRIGKSKISGTLRGVFLAGRKILLTIGQEAWRDWRARAEARAALRHSTHVGQD